MKAPQLKQIDVIINLDCINPKNRLQKIRKEINLVYRKKYSNKNKSFKEN